MKEKKAKNFVLGYFYYSLRPVQLFGLFSLGCFLFCLALFCFFVVVVVFIIVLKVFELLLTRTICFNILHKRNF